MPVFQLVVSNFSTVNCELLKLDDRIVLLLCVLSVSERHVLACRTNCQSSSVSAMQQQRAEDVTGRSWYHGAVARCDAEALVRRDGEYLVRDSSTQSGSYVLTLRWAAVPLHFVINQRPSSDVAVPSSRMLYHFEEDTFQTVGELLDWYVSQRKPITESSGAIASVPVMRGDASPERRPASVPTVCRFTAVDIPVDDVAALAAPVRGHQRVGSEPLLSPQALTRAQNWTFNALDTDCGGKTNLTGSDSDLTRPPPPKPTRLPTIRIGRDEKKPIVQIRNQALYDDDDGKDYSDYSQVVNQTSTALLAFIAAHLVNCLTSTVAVWVQL